MLLSTAVVAGPYWQAGVFRCSGLPPARGWQDGAWQQNAPRNPKRNRALMLRHRLMWPWQLMQTCRDAGAD